MWEVVSSHITACMDETHFPYYEAAEGENKAVQLTGTLVAVIGP